MPSVTRPVIIHSHTIDTTPLESFEPGGTSGDVTWRTLLSSSSTPTDTFTTGIATCAPNGGHLALHRHTHAEIYYIISGSGIVIIEGEEYWVKKGSVVFVPSNALHGARSLCRGEGDRGVGGEDGEELKWLYVFAADDFGDVMYRFEGHEEAERGDKKNIKAKL